MSIQNSPEWHHFGINRGAYVDPDAIIVGKSAMREDGVYTIVFDTGANFFQVLDAYDLLSDTGITFTAYRPMGIKQSTTAEMIAKYKLTPAK